MEMEGGLTGFAGLPSRETRETFGDSVPAVAFAFVSLPNTFGEVGGTQAGAAPARLLLSRKG